MIKKLEDRKQIKGCGFVVDHIVDKMQLSPHMIVQFNTCLCKISHPLLNTLLTLTRFFDKGIMPFSGGLMEQPAKIIELLEITLDAKICEEKILMESKKNG